MSIIVEPLSEPIKQRFGILQSVQVESVDDSHWQAGEPIFFRSLPCGPAECFPFGECVDGVYEGSYGVDGKPSVESEFGEACGLQVIYGSKCAARTLLDPDIDVRGQALQGLRCKAAIALEKAVWDGLAGSADSKLGCVPEFVDVCPDPVKPVSAFAVIENAFAECGMLGYIHVPVGLLPFLDGLVQNVDGVLRTLAGSVVIAGAGYGDSAGDGSSTSIYGTGQVRVFAGDEVFSPDVSSSEVLEAVNFRRNEVEWFAEQAWAVGFDPCCGPFKASALFC